MIALSFCTAAGWRKCSIRLPQVLQQAETGTAAGWRRCSSRLTQVLQHAGAGTAAGWHRCSSTLTHVLQQAGTGTAASWRYWWRKNFAFPNIFLLNYFVMLFLIILQYLVCVVHLYFYLSVPLWICKMTSTYYIIARCRPVTNPLPPGLSYILTGQDLRIDWSSL